MRASSGFMLHITLGLDDDCFRFLGLHMRAHSMRNQFRQLVCWVADQGSCLWVVMRQLAIFEMCCSVLVDLPRVVFFVTSIVY